jgi:hypothetical protein
MNASKEDMEKWGVICRLREALRAATGLRFDRQWDNVLTDVAPEVMKIIDEARGAVVPTGAPLEPLTGGDADINVRVRVKRDWIPGSALSGKTGTLASYGNDGHAWIRDHDTGGYWAVPPDQIERAPAECPHCGASQVTR